MAPRHGITVHPGSAVDFSALARLAPKASKLVARATTNAGGIVFITALALIVVGLIFMGVVLVLILKNKRQRRKRQRKMEISMPGVKHQYQVLDDSESGQGGVYELPQANQVRDPIPLQKVELDADMNEVPKVQQLDGYAAPPKRSSQPVELPSEAHTINTRLEHS